MAETETLDNLLGPGPSAEGNPDADAGGKGPKSTDASQGAPAGGLTLEQRLAELETANKRNVERLQGAEQSALQWKTQAEQSQAVVQQLTGKLQEIADGSGRRDDGGGRPPQDFVSSLADMLGYEPDQQAVSRMWQAMRGGNDTTRQQPAQNTGEYVTKQDLDAYTTRQANQQQAIQAMVAQHPELNDAGFLQEVIAEYDTLRQDPMTSTLYPEAQDGPSVVNFWGRNFDLRLIDKAAANHKAKSAAVGEQRNGATLEGGTKVPDSAKDKSPVVPTAFVGTEGVFGNPSVQQALQRAGWGANTRQQIEHMLKNLPESLRQSWEQQHRAAQ